LLNNIVCNNINLTQYATWTKHNNTQAPKEQQLRCVLTLCVLFKGSVQGPMADIDGDFTG